MKKKILISTLIVITTLVIVAVALVIGWGEYVKKHSIIGGNKTITANAISDTPEQEEKTFKYGKYKFVYYNAYNKNGEFVLLDGGYIYSTNGCPLYIMRINYSEYVNVYKLDKDCQQYNPIEEVGQYGQGEYFVFEAPNFMIKYEVEDTNAEYTLGVLFFYS